MCFPVKFLYRLFFSLLFQPASAMVFTRSLHSLQKAPSTGILQHDFNLLFLGQSIQVPAGLFHNCAYAACLVMHVIRHCRLMPVLRFSTGAGCAQPRLVLLGLLELLLVPAGFSLDSSVLACYVATCVYRTPILSRSLTHRVFFNKDCPITCLMATQFIETVHNAGISMISCIGLMDLLGYGQMAHKNGMRMADCIG